MENKKRYSKFLALFLFISFLFLFSFVFNIQNTKAVSCTQNEICTTSDGCDGIRYCTNGQYGGCVKNNPSCGSGTARCGDGVCNGTETSSNCSADCSGGGGACEASSCVVNGVPKACGQKSYCGYPCSACPGGQTCYGEPALQPTKYNCGGTCSDTDFILPAYNGDRFKYLNYFEKGTVTDRTSKPSTDYCTNDKNNLTPSKDNKGEFLVEYYCMDPTYAIKDGYDGYVQKRAKTCEFGCENGACNKTCVPTKTGKDYPGQCGLFFDDGCTKYGLDLSKNCKNEKVNKYCDSETKKCTKLVPKNCCVGLWGAVKQGDTFLNEPCFNLKNTDCKKKSGCYWITPLSPAKPFCGNLYAKDVDSDMKENQPACQSSIILTNTANRITKTTDFLKNNNCRTLNFFTQSHENKEECGPLYAYISACYECNGSDCAYYGVNATGCSIYQDESEVDMQAKMLYVKLWNKHDKTTIFSIRAKQTVANSCTPTDETVNIGYNGISYIYPSCDPIYEMNNKIFYGIFGGGGCFGKDMLQARGEIAICRGTDNNKYKLMCCAATNNEDSKWNWVFVNYDNPQCPSPTAFSNILRNTSGLLRPITDTFSNLIVIVTSAVSVAVVGIWWLISKIFLKK